MNAEDTFPAAPRRVECCDRWPDCNHPDRYEDQDTPPTSPTPDQETIMPEPLPPYSGDDPRCVKCGNKGAFTSYRATGRCIHGKTSIVLGFEPNERLHRRCGRCDYEWDEALAEPEKAAR